MNFFKWLFGGREEEKGHVEQPKSNNVYHLINVAANVVASPIPDWVSWGNKVCDGKYQEAIDRGLILLKRYPAEPGVHITLMDAYFKARKQSPDYIEKSTYHARLAILYGHHTGYAYERLAKNLERAKSFHLSLQLYALILDTKGFHFSANGVGNVVDWEKRRKNALNRLPKASDKDSDVLFTQTEISQILKGIKDEDLRVKLEDERSKRIFKKMEEAIERDDFDLFDRLMAELHTPIKLN